MGSAISIIQGAFGRASLVCLTHPVVTHAHPEFNFFIRCAGAETRFRIGKRIFPLHHDNLLVANSWEPHANLHDGEQPTWLLSLLIHPDWSPTQFSGWQSGGQFPASALPLHPEVRMAADELAALMADAAPVEAAEHALTRLIGTLMCGPGWEARVPSVRRAVSPVDFRIQRALAYMRKHPSRRLRTPDIARAAGLSRSHFYDRFRVCIGTSPQCFRDWICMVTAIDELGSPKSISQVSCDLGFNSPSHFSRFFSQRTGVPPLQFRRRAHRMEATR